MFPATALDIRGSLKLIEPSPSEYFSGLALQPASLIMMSLTALNSRG